MFYLLRGCTLEHVMVGVVGVYPIWPAFQDIVVKGTQLVPERVPKCNHDANKTSSNTKLATPSVACATSIIHGVHAARIVMQRNRLR